VLIALLGLWVQVMAKIVKKESKIKVGMNSRLYASVHEQNQVRQPPCQSGCTTATIRYVSGRRLQVVGRE
jgi:hypothetical protein